MNVGVGPVCFVHRAGVLEKGKEGALVELIEIGVEHGGKIVVGVGVASGLRGWAGLLVR